MSEPRKERCETCRFWNPGEKTEVEYVGYCQRMPPTILESRENPLSIDSRGTGCTSYFPIVDYDDWCGEWHGAKRDDQELDTTPEATEELRRDIQAVLKQLSWREREVVKLRYGLGDGMVYTLEECAHIFKVTRERIRAIEKKAITKIGMMPGADKLLERFSKLQQSAVASAE